MAMDKVLNVREFFFSMLEAGKVGGGTALGLGQRARPAGVQQWQGGHKQSRKQGASTANAGAPVAVAARACCGGCVWNPCCNPLPHTLQQASQEEDAASAAAAAKHAKAASEAKPPPCGCPSAAQCTCMLPNGSAAKLAAQQLTICHSVALADDAAPAGPEGGSPLGRGQCPFTGLSLSQIAELKKTPPEQLQRTWRGIAQRLA